MSPTPAIVHLIGFPAAGKYTVAKALAHAADARGERFVVTDNHLTGNVILSVVDGVPDGTWDRVRQVREVMYDAIAELSPPSWSFVFTNVLVAGDVEDEAAPGRLADVAAARGSIYLPVLLTCEVDEVIARVPSPERRERHKWIDPDAVRSFMERAALVDLSAHDPYELDTTTRPAEEAARLILDEHARRSAS